MGRRGKGHGEGVTGAIRRERLEVLLSRDITGFLTSTATLLGTTAQLGISSSHADLAITGSGKALFKDCVCPADVITFPTSVTPSQENV